MSDCELIPANPAENPFQLEPNRPGFESLGNDNGFRFWWGSTLAELLGYASMDSFFKSVQKAMGICISLGIDLNENIVPQAREVRGKVFTDYKLSRFACYLAAMNGDVKKPEVAQAQAYFAAFAVAMQEYVEHAEAVERVHIRGEVSERERSLSGVAKGAGVEKYAIFQNAGYRGLYNMDISRLRMLKGVPDNRSPLDFMGKEELATNLFRITQTEAKIRRETVRGQRGLEVAAETVGKTVRGAIREMGGTMPERLASSPDIKAVQKNLKSTHRNFKRIDSGKKKKKG